ncbi:MAG TPA: hypothetical protein VMZ53_05375 [Kofleriaceae bacterium]|nr:hypothetical protein [Kofleriaceae bacterium]
MTELSRSLLAAARDGLAPDPDVAARVRARVAAAVGAPLAKPVTAKPVPSGGSGALLKLGALVVVAGVVTGGLALRRDARIESPRVSASTTDVDLEPAQSASTQEHAAPPAAAKPARSVAPASLAREVELIDQAMSALRREEPAAALAFMRTFDRETLGHAQMAEEAAAITIEARCGLGEDVAARIAAFDEAWPSSAERSRITDACR